MEKAAVEPARKMTDTYESTWGWLGEPDIPMRRPWHNLIHNLTGVMP